MAHSTVAEDSTPITAQDTTEDLSRINLAAPESFVEHDMARYWRRLRTDHPVYRHPATEQGPAFWVLSGYEDVLALFKDEERFSSRAGNMLPSLHKPQGDPAAGKVLALTDNPRHVAMRTMLLKAFTPKIRQFVVDRLQQRADELIAGLVGTGPFDFAAEVAEQLPIGTICDLLGVPAQDRPLILELSRDTLSSDEVGQTADDAWLARNELLVYCSELMEQRRAEPQDDLLSAMVNTRVGGELLTDDEVLTNFYGFILAGDHTSRLAMVGGVQALIEHPGQWQALKEGRVTVASAVDEIIRWTTPVMHVARKAVVDVPLGGRLIRAGDIVTAWNISANRDERIFDRPDELDLARTPNKHLSFGYGPHFCFGAYLGRAEISAVLTALIRSVDVMRVEGEPRQIFSTFLRGFSHLPVSFEAGPGNREGTR